MNDDEDDDFGPGPTGPITILLVMLGLSAAMIAIIVPLYLFFSPL